MRILSFLVLFFLSFSGCHSQSKAPDANKIVTSLYEIEYDSSFFDVYNQKNDGFVLFFKSENDDDFLDCIKLSIENTEKYKTMDLDYYASLMVHLLQESGKIVENKKVAGEDGFSYYSVVCEKPSASGTFKIYQRIYFHKGYGLNLSLRTVSGKFDRLFTSSDKIFQSFKLLN